MGAPAPRSQRAVVERSVAEFFREAAVLVGVFGYLDPIFKGGAIRPAWVILIAAATITLFVLGLFFEIKASSS